MVTILGAGGAIGNELITLLSAKNQPFRLVGRNPKATPGATETVAADLTDRDQTIRAVADSSVVYLLVGLKHDLKVWQEMWPRIMRNTIEACKRAGAKLLFFDNVYMYGKVSGLMTEETPFNPCSKKWLSLVCAALSRQTTRRAFRPTACTTTRGARLSGHD